MGTPAAGFGWRSFGRASRMTRPSGHLTQWLPLPSERRSGRWPSGKCTVFWRSCATAARRGAALGFGVSDRRPDFGDSYGVGHAGQCGGPLSGP